MELRQLSYFIAVVENGTISGAARLLHMSQPPLTAQMHALENELGCALFEHVGRRLRITEAGQTLYERAKSIIGLCDSARTEMADFRSGAAGMLHIGVISSVCGSEFLGWIGDFAQKYPHARYDLHEANTYQLLSQLRARRIDLAIVRTPFAAPDLCVLPMRREAMLAIGQSQFFKTCAPGEITCAQLTDMPLILYRRWAGIFRACFERQGLTPEVICTNDNAFTTLALARSGLGVALVPASTLINSDGESLALRRIEEPDMYSEISVIYRGDSELPSLARLFIDILSDDRQVN